MLLYASHVPSWYATIAIVMFPIGMYPNVINMVGIFYGANSFNGDISSWDVSSVTDMHDMFRGNNNNFNSDISNWDVSSVTDMSAYVFRKLHLLIAIYGFLGCF